MILYISLLSTDSQIGLYYEGFISQDELELQNYVITINESYLRKHPIYDTQGNPVELSGKREENYLLVPEKYHSHEKELKIYYEENNTFLKYYIDYLKKMGIEAVHQLKQINTKLRITALLVSWGLTLVFFPVLHLPFNAASLLTIAIIFFMDIFQNTYICAHY